mmetsp:Transcript_4765/g.7719  ORF Transcript_4765/g.7719 Transcript_4765/m.7719 type:complete len:162 (-) Transcript_4765:2096-2581(-)
MKCGAKAGIALISLRVDIKGSDPLLIYGTRTCSESRHSPPIEVFLETTTPAVDDDDAHCKSNNKERYRKSSSSSRSWPRGIIASPSSSSSSSSESSSSSSSFKVAAPIRRSRVTDEAGITLDPFIPTDIRPGEINCLERMQLDLIHQSTRNHSNNIITGRS